MKRTYFAFTLTELLTVIAIIAVLAALVLAAISRARLQAQAAFCKNNLAQIGKALELYTSDFGKYPGTRSAPMLNPAGLPGGWDQIWDRRLLPYAAGKDAIFKCPADPVPHVMVYFSLTNYSYGYNEFGSGFKMADSLNLGLGHANPPETDFSTQMLTVSAAQIVAPSEMIAVGDLTDMESVFITALVPSLSPYFVGGPAARHDGGANVVFCDGHIEFAKQANWVEKTDAARRRWNNDHQSHSETW